MFSFYWILTNHFLLKSSGQLLNLRESNLLVKTRKLLQFKMYLKYAGTYFNIAKDTVTQQRNTK